EALPPMPLRAVRGHREALHVAAPGDGDDHLLLGDEVLEVDLALARDDLGEPGVGMALADLVELLADDRVDAALVGEDPPEVQDLPAKLVALRTDLSRLELGHALEAEGGDPAGLDLGEVEAAHEPLPRLAGVGGAADERDDLVEVGQGDEEALEDVRLALGPGQAEAGAPDNHLALVGEVVPDHGVQGERPR